MSYYVIVPVIKTKYNNCRDADRKSQCPNSESFYREYFKNNILDRDPIEGICSGYVNERVVDKFGNTIREQSYPYNLPQRGNP